MTDDAPRGRALPPGATQAVAASRPFDATGKWAVVGMLWCVCFFNYADRQSIFSVFPTLRQEFGFDPVQLGLIGSAFMWVYAAGAPVAGFLADRLPRKHLILGGCLFWSGITVTTAWCGRLWQFVTVRALEGVGETFYFPATVSLISDYHGPRTRSKALSLHQSGVYIGTIGGSWLGAWFAEHLGWRAGFYFFGGMGLLLALVLYRFLREAPRGAAEPAARTHNIPPDAPAAAGAGSGTPPAVHPPGLGEVVPLILRKPTALLLMAVFLGANFVATIFLTWTPTFLVEKFGFALTSAGLTGAVFIHLASAASAPAGGLFADRLARRHPGGRMIVQACGLLAGTAFVALVGLTHDVRTLVISMTLFGVSKGLYDSNIFASLYDVIEPRARATAAGLMNTVGWGGGALGPLAVGLATAYGRHAAAGGSEAARRAAEMANMSEAIAAGSVIYVLGGVLLLIAALVFARRDRLS